MHTLSYIEDQIKKTRTTMHGDSFGNLDGLTIALRGKSIYGILSLLGAEGASKNDKAVVEIIDPAVLDGVSAACEEGAAVGADNVFSASDPIVWVDGKIFFSSDGGLFSPDEYRYLMENGLSSRAVFARPLHPSRGGLSTVYKQLLRAAKEASTDKAKDILYLTAGIGIWHDLDRERACGRKGPCRAPLFTMHIGGSGGRARLIYATEEGVSLRINTVFRRAVENQYHVDLYEGIREDAIPPEEIEAALLRVEQNAAALCDRRLTVDREAVCLARLDSQLESICQSIEKNIDSIASSRLTALLAGEEVPPPEADGLREDIPMIYPLAADESQRAVIAASLAGKSVYAAAPAGTGKSQTAVNIAANTVLRGGSVLVLSEKRAAGEVFVHYSRRIGVTVRDAAADEAREIGLDAFCLYVDNSMTLSTVAAAIERLEAFARRARYVKSDAARSLLREYRLSVSEYERLTEKLYRPIEAIGGISLYDLIARAVTGTPLKEDGFCLSPSDYTEAMHALSLLARYLGDMNAAQFDAFFHADESTGDPELDGLLTYALRKTKENGLDCKVIFTSNDLNVKNALAFVEAEAARRIALHYGKELELEDVGGRRVRAIYETLFNTAEGMERLYRDLLLQELSERARRAPLAPLLARIEDARRAKVSVGEFIKENAALLREVFPIVVSTPLPAVNYLHGTELDRFTVMTVDEASQMPIISVLPFLDRVERLVVFGDEKQLSIVNTFARKEEDDGTADYEERNNRARASVLDSVRGRVCDESFFAGALCYHYRSKTEMLVHVSNEACYNGSLQVVPDVATGREHLKPDMGLSLIRVSIPPALLADKDWSFKINPPEASRIVSDVIAAREQYPAHSIGIITMNTEQQNLIIDRLEEAGIEPSDDLWVRALDNAQGKEADFIFISIAHSKRTKNDQLHTMISTFNRDGGINRLNVLFTRAAYKCFIYVSFDYRELARAQNPGIHLLYEYLRYADEGKLNAGMSGDSCESDGALVRAIASLVSELDPALEGHERIGSPSVSVDVALKRASDAAYFMGLLMPSYGQSAVAAVTKLLSLRSAGWSLLPLSPTYLLSAPALFSSQLKTLLGGVMHEKEKAASFLTERKPPVLFTPMELAWRLFSTDPLSTDALAALDLVGVYRRAMPKNLFSCPEETLRVSTEPIEKLAYYVRILPRHIKEGRLSELASSLLRLYAKERMAGLLLASILRTITVNEQDMRRIVTPLLAEAQAMGIFC